MSDYGYRVPEGDAAIAEMACQLVFYPDIPEYRTALFTALERFAVWTSWQREDDHKGKDAADSWKAANELTWECWRMACLEQLQADVSAILALLQLKDDCCSDNTTYGDSTTYVTVIVPGNGTAPTTYGETAIDGWQEWRSYVCYNGNLWVDELIRAAYTIEVALDTGGLSIGLLAAVMGAVAFIAVGGVLALPLIMVAIAGLSANVAATIFADAAVDIEDARQDILCALIGGTSVSDAVEDALSSGTAWDLLFSLMDYDSATALLYEGGYDTTYLEAETSSDCESGCCQNASFLQPNPYAVMLNNDEDGCVFEMYKATTDNNRFRGSLQFNKIPSGAYCGVEKVIDTAAVNDSILFSHIITRDDEGNTIQEWGDSGGSCQHNINVLNNKTCAGFYIDRKDVPFGGCASSDPITITLTYHDAT